MIRMIKKIRKINVKKGKLSKELRTAYLCTLLGLIKEKAKSMWLKINRLS